MGRLRATIALLMMVPIAGAICAQELPVIKLRRTACFGTCPIYSLEIFEDGRLHFNGEQFVAAIGPREAQIAPSTVNALIQEFRKIDYFDLKDVYESYQNPDGTTEWISDLSTTYISLRIGTRSKTIKDYAFSPESLEMLEHEIERVANTHRWIHGDDDLKSPEMVQSDVYWRTKPGLSPLMQDAGKGDTEALMKEHSKGADINAQDETGWTALMLAAEQCHEDVVRQILDLSAKVETKDRHGDDALMGASSAFCTSPSARDAQASIVKMLIAHGGNPNIQDDAGLTPLIAVTKYANAEVAQFLIEEGANLDTKDNEGKTALDHARDVLNKRRNTSWAEEAQQLVKLLEQSSDRRHPGALAPE